MEAQNNLPKVAENREAFDLATEKDKVMEELRHSQEIENLTSTINVWDSGSIIEFGNDIAKVFSKSSDQILAVATKVQEDRSEELFNTLGGIMEAFDMDEIAGTGKPKGFLAKLFGGGDPSMDDVLKKYHTIGEEVDKVYLGLKSFEGSLKEINTNLQLMLQSNMNYYHQLIKYIVAGEQAQEELSAFLEQTRAQTQGSPDGTKQMDLQTLENSHRLLDQRVYDLKILENVAMQTIMTIKFMQFNNTTLMQKMNSAFLITLPVFKQSLAQAILMKRQNLQRQAMRSIDDKASKMLEKNAMNSQEVPLATTSFQGQNAQLEESWKTIMDGLQETKDLQKQGKDKIAKNTGALIEFKKEYQSTQQ